MSNEDIEIFRGVSPKCLNCGKPLRPQYRTENERFGEGTGKKKVWLPRPGCEGTETYPPPDDPAKDGQEDRDHVGPIWWSKRRRSWYRNVTYRKVRKRVFTGKFGSRHDNFFCLTECGYRWGLKQARKLYGEKSSV